MEDWSTEGVSNMNTERIAQICPVCAGRGAVGRGFYEDPSIGCKDFSKGKQECKSCYGKGVIRK